MRHATVVVGAGHGGFETVQALRLEGYRGAITLVDGELPLPYQRPPLSKNFLLGSVGEDALEFRPAAFYADHDITLVLGDPVVAVDRAAKHITLGSGQAMRYDALVLALGARTKSLRMADGTSGDIVYLRTVRDASGLRDRLERASSVAVVGGGFIGLEVAAVAKKMGTAVAIVEAQPRLLCRAVASPVSEFFLELHRQHGSSVHCETTVQTMAAEPSGRPTLLLSSGETVAADLIVAGVGVEPNVGLARAAGLAVANGISVDEYLRTSDPDIYALGDCAEHPNPFAGGRVRLESVQNAADQGRAVAATIAGRPMPYTAVPWFWSDQFDTRLQMAGLSHEFDRSVIRGQPERGKFSVYYFNAARLVGVDSVNRPLDHVVARKLLTQRVSVSPEQARDDTTDLRRLLA